MAGSYFNDKDSTDISELAALNNDISDDMIEELSVKLSKKAINFKNGNYDAMNEYDDASLFEETSQESNNITVESKNEETNPVEQNPPEPEIKETVSEEKAIQKEETPPGGINLNDDFAKKFKAKLNKVEDEPQNTEKENSKNENIENITQGNISERPLTKELKDYNDSLDFLDGNVKYSKYVIYIDPQNVDFIDGLTVKERKNLINGILHEQNDIAITKRRFKFIQTVVRHVIIAILTLSVSIPVVYYAINASLEATIDNHRRSQTNWQTLYRDNGKITHN